VGYTCKSYEDNQVAFFAIYPPNRPPYDSLPQDTIPLGPWVRGSRAGGRGVLREGPFSPLENSPSWRPGEYQIGIYLQEGFNAHNLKGNFPPADEPIL